ncbi:class I SAM-dependent methyltransferase [Deinococcus sonorensis]|uniref:Class I SAM-dependent methyltransferase n=2 Tax=Deinococcus sonorensis TaxID=309891 RepID=A0AAU7UB87_9DEIO
MTAESDPWAAHARRTVGGPRPLLTEALELLGRPRRRVALDLGCGAGNDTLALLERGWTVTALDGSAGALALVQERAGVHRTRLTPLEAGFHQVPRRRYTLVYASLSLPFTPPARWDRTWRAVRRAVGVRGWFAATLFGPRDGWAGEPDMSFITAQALRERLDGFEPVVLREWEGEIRLAAGGLHPSHTLTVIARRLSR